MSAAKRYLTLNSRDLRWSWKSFMPRTPPASTRSVSRNGRSFSSNNVSTRSFARELRARAAARDLALREQGVSRRPGHRNPQDRRIRAALHAPHGERRPHTGLEGGVLEVRANYVALETLLDEFTRVFNTGQYRDKLVVEEGRLKFKEKLCIFDSLLVPNSLIYPL